MGILSATSFLVLLVIIGMRMTTKREEVGILDLIGATPGFIRSPIVLEALIYATAGVLIGWLSSFIIWLYLSPNIVRFWGHSGSSQGNLKLFRVFRNCLGC